MRSATTRLVLTSMLLGWTPVASAQTADEIVEKYLTAIGGRAALAKVKSRVAAGTVTLATPAGDIKGTIEILSAAPNKSRMLVKADLTALGAGQLVIDQRFDGHSGYILDTLQGNREMAGNQLDNMRNGSFPAPLMNYKDQGATLKLSGKEKVGDRDAFLLVLEPTAGSVVQNYIDAETYLLIKTVTKVNVPQLGQDVEQTSEFLEHREVDGIKVPFKMKSSSSVQNFALDFTKVEHNVAVDETLFSKPPAF